MLLSNLISEDKEMSELKVLREQADSYFNVGKYKEAYQKYEELVNELLSYLDSTKLARTLKRCLELESLILSISVDPPELIHLPIVNLALKKLFNIDLENLLENLRYGLRQRHVCLIQLKDLVKNVDFEAELNYFVLDYTINTKISQSKYNKLKIALKLIPISKVFGQNSIEKKKSLPEVYDILLSEIERRDGDVERINSYLLAFMEKSGRTNNPVYSRLKSKGFAV